MLIGAPPPAVFWNGRLWPSDELSAMAAGWLDTLRASMPPTAQLTALPLSKPPRCDRAVLRALDLPSSRGRRLDSVHLLETIIACEETFAVELDPAVDFTETTLRSVQTLFDLIRSKRAG